MYKLIDGFLYKSERNLMVPVNSFLLSGSSNDMCVICMRRFTASPKNNRLFVKRAKCAHVYHADCLNRWLEKHTTCPMCRFPLFYHVDNSELLTSGRSYRLVPVTANHWNIEHNA
jgi:hypothetical protein